MEEMSCFVIDKDHAASGVEHEHRHWTRLQECKDLGTKHRQPNC
jgi:hypothetical protein